MWGATTKNAEMIKVERDNIGREESFVTFYKTTISPSSDTFYKSSTHSENCFEASF